MSDGTLRVLGILLAIYQPSESALIGVEEPESTIHPAAMDALVQILKDGQHRAQILVTTHSPDVLDNKTVSLNAKAAMMFHDYSSRTSRSRRLSHRTSQRGPGCTRRTPK